MRKRILASLMVLLMVMSIFVPQMNAQATEIQGETNTVTYGVNSFTVTGYDIGNNITDMRISTSNGEWTLAYLVMDNYSSSETDEMFANAIKVNGQSQDIQVEGTKYVYVWNVNEAGESVSSTSFYVNMGMFQNLNLDMINFTNGEMVRNYLPIASYSKGIITPNVDERFSQIEILVNKDNVLLDRVISDYPHNYAPMFDHSALINESGTYTITSQARGDTAISNWDCMTYNYVKPEEKMDSVTDIQWSDKKAGKFTFEPIEDGYQYSVSLYRFVNGEESYSSYNVASVTQPESGRVTVDLSYMMQDGVTYKVGIRAVSSDIEMCANGDEVLSEIFDPSTVVEVEIPNDKNGIPDTNLYNAILECADKNNDGILFEWEAEELISLYAAENEITDLTGIQYFTNLEELYLWNNQITDISQLSSLIKLYDLDLSYNQIVDVTTLANLTNLSYLDLNYNKIEDVSALSNLNLELGDTLLIEGNPVVSNEEDESNTPQVPETPDTETTPDTEQVSDIETTPDIEGTPDTETTPDTEQTPDTEVVPEQKPVVELEKDKIEKTVETISTTQTGTQITIDMSKSDGTVATVVPSEVLEAARENNVNIVLDMGNYSWSINSNDILDGNLSGINLEVTMDTNAIPSATVDALANGDKTRQLSLTHNGDFRFKAALTIEVGSEYGGKFGNLYYHESTGKLVFMNAGKIQKDGTVTVNFSHASDYVIVIGDDRTEKVSDTEGNQSNTNVVLPPANATTPTEESPKTGDVQSIVWILLVVIAVLFGGRIVKIK